MKIIAHAMGEGTLEHCLGNNCLLVLCYNNLTYN